ncbi:MAG: tRNA (adenosine(37)-N6)-threonylcarbamoyltransferase complex dimerization subunit type 1 TsaB [Fervidobacterium sp.]|nr:tRNA (adenosine(37)-N6)-threonylcarbamoyltransferase complex dimerization subunit type 1 TsaB [Fervidobacterium sp.]
MKIFAIDTSTPRVVACYCDDEQKMLVELETKAKHGIQVTQIADMLNNVDFGDLDIIGVGIGPGSLTGLRVGIAFATGLGIGKKFVEINSLKLIAYNLEFYNGYVVVLRKAREGYLYGAIYKGNGNQGLIEEIEKPFIDDIESVRKKVKAYAPSLCIGDGAEFFENRLDENNYNVPSARNLLRLVEMEINAGRLVDVVEPLYLQKSIAELNFEKREQKLKGS